ncbi:MAG TPA: peptidylprolyl isomerase [Chitinophagaceae bacterium]|nr:peptidylprolyl isomerase [Chitinophagaceae bacterium]
MKQLKVILLSFLLLGIGTTVLAQKHRKVKIKTPYGKMVFLLSDSTPLHRDNFIKLAKEHFYDGLLFHRVIDSFMVQGGDPTSDEAKPGDFLGNGSIGYTIPAEFKPYLFHRKGALAMAREGDRVNPEQASDGSQFYIVEGKTYTDEELDKISKRTGRTFTKKQREVYRTIGGTPFLDGGYTVFGYMVKGFDVLEKIAEVKTDDNDRPLKDFPMKVRIVHKFLFF